MKVRIWTILGVVIFGIAVSTAVLRSPKHLSQTFDEEFEGTLTRGGVPGGWVVVMRDGKVIKQLNYGVSDLEKQTPVKSTTYMHLGSVGKMFTAACMAQLIADGKVKLDDPLSKILPTAPDSWKSIRIRDLLNQTSGLPDYVDQRLFDFNTEYSENEILAKVESMELTFSPGAHWEYSNTNYLLLGIIIHRLSGQLYGTYLKKSILEPAGVKAIFVEGDAPSGASLSKGYFGSTAENYARPVSKSMSTIADGCLWTNVEGIQQWDKALDRLDKLPKGVKDIFWNSGKLTSGTPTGYGAGWSLTSYNDYPLYWHNGGWQGFTSYYARFPKQHLSIALCVNGGDIDADQLGFNLITRYLPDK